jgi:membrane protease subunit HflK
VWEKNTNWGISRKPERISGLDPVYDEVIEYENFDCTSSDDESYVLLTLTKSDFEEYEKNPEVTRKRMFYETMEDILPQMRVIIDGTDSTTTMLHEQLGDSLGSAEIGAAAVEGGKN